VIAGRLSASVRLLRAGFVLARFGVFDLVAPDDPTPPAPVRALRRLSRALRRRSAPGDAAERLSEALTRLGPTYVKLGQFLATRRDVVGDVLAADLAALQDRLPPFPREEAVRVVEAALGAPLSAHFAEFGPAVAAASIAQVHKARTIEGRQVAVKVLRPGIARRVAEDLENFYAMARTLERVSPPARRLRPVDTVETLARSVALEMDFRLEAAAISEMAENVAQDAGFRVPGIDWLRTAKGVLTLEWVEGTPLGDVAGIKAGHDAPRLAAGLVQHFLRHAMRDGFFHADMHQGNLFVERDGTLVAVDFGIVGRLSRAERRYLAEILYGFLRRNYRRVAEVHFEAGYVPATQDVETFAQALRAIGEPLQDRKAAEISMARLLTQLFEVTDLFEMRTQPQLLLLQKTMVVVEGVARTLDPDFNMWRSSEPVLREWVEGHLGPRAQVEAVAGSAQAIGRFLADLPDLLPRLERAGLAADRIANEGIRLAPESLHALARESARRARWMRIAIWIGALALAAMAAGVFL
jgi:ubiquinone biosynthesis protein